MKIIDNKLVSAVQFDEDPDNYDQRLYNLGKSYNEFLIINPGLNQEDVLNRIDIGIKSRSVVVWKFKDVWLAKKFNKEWHPIFGWRIIDLPTPDPDVFFLSYKEDNAYQNYQQLLKVCPNAKHISNIKGILNAHKQIANQSTTDIFYVVDGDSFVLDHFDFTFQPTIFDRDCTHIWLSHNEIINDTYGHGGIKLLNKQIVLDYQNTDQLDFSTSFTDKIKVMDKVGSIHKFASDPFHAWKGSFRETVKLLTKSLDSDSQSRLHSWRSIIIIDAITQFAVYGVKDAETFFNKQLNLKLINDSEWLEKAFREKYGSK